VSNPADDLEVKLFVEENGEMKECILTTVDRGWERYYRFNYHDQILPYSFEAANERSWTIIARYNGSETEFFVPTQRLEKYSNILTLDLKKGSLIVGEREWRAPVLIASRIALTILIEGIIFYIFGYREKSNWILFIICNLITQTFLNASFGGVNNDLYYWQLVFYATEIFIFIAETLLYTFAFKEKGTKRVKKASFVLLPERFGFRLAPSAPTHRGILQRPLRLRSDTARPSKDIIEVDFFNTRPL
jgi:hypothetical protein